MSSASLTLMIIRPLSLRHAPFIAHSIENSGKTCLKLVLINHLCNLITFGFLNISQQIIDGFT